MIRTKIMHNYLLRKVAVLSIFGISLVDLSSVKAECLEGFIKSPWFNEQVREIRNDLGIRMLINAPAPFRHDLPTLAIFYGTPNGNTIEQTLGTAMVECLDWHFDIQHIAAQTRLLRKLDKNRNIVLICMETSELSWPAWRRQHSNDTQIIRKTIEDVLGEIPCQEKKAVLAAHSGGGSMIFGFIDAYNSIPSWVDRIVFLDANYSYSDDKHHGDKLFAWLQANPGTRLVVIAYDDRRITLNGKLVVGPTGGTFRASHRMLGYFEKLVSFRRSSLGDFDIYSAFVPRANLSAKQNSNASCISFIIHRNPLNKILHTALVGEMNGYLEALTLGTMLEEKWGKFGGTRAYVKWIQPTAPTNIPRRPRHAADGTSVMKKVGSFSLSNREKIILKELKSGNMPDFLRQFKTISFKARDANGKEHSICFYTMPDYLAVGSDKNFVRVPLTPISAQAIADFFKCSLPTRKMVDEIYRQAEVKLEPKPLTEKREAVETFIKHNSIIEEQRKGKPLGALVAGIKKDVVITNLPENRLDHVAIYGWHRLDGTPIQPLSTVHVNWYVDYSHGIRLVKRTVIVDGKPYDIRNVLQDPILCSLLSDEGPITRPFYGAQIHSNVEKSKIAQP
ncbi:MAG: hypothetical protein QHH26_08595 [Armatimonadota bacterium]|nr:hypothetical protein [Armatimonadota bacterium]